MTHEREPAPNDDEGRPPEMCFEMLRLWRNGTRLDETDLHLASQAAGWLREHPAVPEDQKRRSRR